MNPDNTFALFHGWAEMGQGSPTAVRQIAAEELGLSMEQVTAVPLDTNVVVSAFAADSSSTRNAMAATSLRGAAAAARTVLVNLASARLGIPASALTIDNGVVSAGGKSVTYAALMAGVRPRGQAAQVAGAKLLSFDKGSIAHIRGVQVVQKGDFLGVVAPLELRLRVGVVQAGAEGVLQLHDHRPLGGCRAGDRHGRARRTDWLGARPVRIVFRTGWRTSTSTSSAS